MNELFHSANKIDTRWFTNSFIIDLQKHLKTIFDMEFNFIDNESIRLRRNYDYDRGGGYNVISLVYQSSKTGYKESTLKVVFSLYFGHGNCTLSVYFPLTSKSNRHLICFFSFHKNDFNLDQITDPNYLLSLLNKYVKVDYILEGLKDTNQYIIDIITKSIQNRINLLQELQVQMDSLLEKEDGFLLLNSEDVMLGFSDDVKVRKAIEAVEIFKNDRLMI